MWSTSSWAGFTSEADVGCSHLSYHALDRQDLLLSVVVESITNSIDACHAATILESNQIEFNLKGKEKKN